MGMGAGVSVGIEDVSVAAGEVGDAVVDVAGDTVGKVEDVGEGEVNKVADGRKMADGEKVAESEGARGVKSDRGVRHRERDRKDKDIVIDTRKPKKREGDGHRRAMD